MRLTSSAPRRGCATMASLQGPFFHEWTPTNSICVEDPDDTFGSVFGRPEHYLAIVSGQTSRYGARLAAQAVSFNLSQLKCFTR
jgi:hypothetical protein